MGLMDSNGGLSAADVAAVTNGGNGFGFGGDGAWWLLVLFLFAFNGGGWGNNGGNWSNVGGFQSVNNDVQRGFDQQAVMNSLGNLNSTVANGFADAAVAQCNQTASILQGFSGVQTQIANAGYNTASGIADLKYTIATEACSDRSAVGNGIRDVIESQNRNTQLILDKLCQQEIDALKTQNANLQTQINMANVAASQNAQTGQLLADNAAQTAVLRQALNPTPIPAYVVQNPSCCNPTYTGCGCGGVA